jgi:hypothetical protein
MPPWRWRMFARSADDSLSQDIAPHLGASLGNVQTFANVGTTVSLGFNLPNDFGTEPIAGGPATNSPLDERDPRLGSGRRTSLFVFGGVDGRAVGRDLFLDGNTWEGSPSVDKKTLVGDSYWGPRHRPREVAVYLHVRGSLERVQGAAGSEPIRFDHDLAGVSRFEPALLTAPAPAIVFVFAGRS